MTSETTLHFITGLVLASTLSLLPAGCAQTLDTEAQSEPLIRGARWHHVHINTTDSAAAAADLFAPTPTAPPNFLDLDQPEAPAAVPAAATVGLQGAVVELLRWLEQPARQAGAGTCLAAEDEAPVLIAGEVNDDDIEIFVEGGDPKKRKDGKGSQRSGAWGRKRRQEKQQEAEAG